MEAAIDRIMPTSPNSAAASEEARVKVTDYLTMLFEAGEKDTNRHGVRADLFARTRRLQRIRSRLGLPGCRRDEHVLSTASPRRRASRGPPPQ